MGGQNWHNITAKQALEELKADTKRGLSSGQAEQRLAQYGYNRLESKKKKGIVAKFFEQFSDFMVIVLLIAAAVSFVTSMMEGSGDYVDSIIILIIVVINAITGVVQESKAERAIEALQQLSAPSARVLREGKARRVPSEEVVPGDILLLEAGDFIAADARLIEAHSLKVEESSLTGESVPVEKDASLLCPAKAPLGDRKNMVFATSTVTCGHALCVVTGTGMHTQVGTIAHMINEGDSPQTPLQTKLAQTGKYLGIGALVICLAIFLLGLIQRVEPLEMFMLSISLAVAAIPEGLPAVVTIVLAIGVRRMAVCRAIVRKLPAVETLGSATVICSDKTGTLTQNKMTVTELAAPGGKVAASSAAGQEILAYAALCNNAALTPGKPPNGWEATGEPTETALVLAAARAGKPKPQLEKQFVRVGEIPFDSGRKLMSTVHRLGGGRYRIITKGAPDVLLQRCTHCWENGSALPMTDQRRRRIEQQNQEMASRALRVLGVARRDVDTLPQNQEQTENGLTFMGLCGMIDPPRPQAKEAVRQCRRAGIRPVMITGDHVVTARAIATQLGILQDGDLAMTGAQLEETDQQTLEKNIGRYAVFARVSPAHKVRIVKAFQARGQVVAMTGDGVNDAPALKAADIGCAMGIAGTDVAKGAADMILTDDNFATIVDAVRQGRGIFANIRRTVHFLLSSNIGEIVTVLTAFLLRLPTPLLAIQLLWVNLVTDSLPALALGMEPVEPDAMQRPPENSKKSLFAGGMAYSIAVEGCFIGAISLLAFTIGRVFFDTPGAAPVVGRTMAFSVLSLSQLVHAQNVRSKRSLFSIGLLGNARMLYAFAVCALLQISVVSIPVLSAIFKTTPLSWMQWGIVAALSLAPLAVVELEKALLRKRRAGRATGQRRGASAGYAVKEHSSLKPRNLFHKGKREQRR